MDSTKDSAEEDTDSTRDIHCEADRGLSKLYLRKDVIVVNLRSQKAACSLPVLGSFELHHFEGRSDPVGQPQWAPAAKGKGTRRDPSHGTDVLCPGGPFFDLCKVVRSHLQWARTTNHLSTTRFTDLPLILRKTGRNNVSQPPDVEITSGVKPT